MTSVHIAPVIDVVFAPSVDGLGEGLAPARTGHVQHSNRIPFAGFAPDCTDQRDFVGRDDGAECADRDFQDSVRLGNRRLGCRHQIVFFAEHSRLPSLMRGGEYDHICGEKTSELRFPTKNRPPCRDHDDRPAATANQRREANGNDYNLAQNSLELNRPALPVTICASGSGFPDREICGCREAPVTTSSCLRSLSQGVVTGTLQHSCLENRRHTHLSWRVCRLPANFHSACSSRRAGSTAGRASRHPSSQPSTFPKAHLLPRPTVAAVRFPQQVLACGQVEAGGRHDFISERSNRSPAPVFNRKYIAHLVGSLVVVMRNLARSALRHDQKTIGIEANEYR